MNKDVSEKIKSVSDDLRRKALNAFRLKIREIYSRGDYTQFIPENVLREAVRAAGDNMRQLIADAAHQVSGISVSPSAFKLFDAAMHSHLATLEDVVAQGNGAPLMGNLPKVAADQFETVRAEMQRSLDLHGSSFTDPKNKGGSPGTWDWEGALAVVAAVAERDGLPPPEQRGAQAHIVRLFIEWFTHQHDRAPDDKQLKEKARKVLDAMRFLNRGEISFPPFPPDKKI